MVLAALCREGPVNTCCKVRIIAATRILCRFDMLRPGAIKGLFDFAFLFSSTSLCQPPSDAFQDHVYCIGKHKHT